MRKKIIAGNWKMYKTMQEAEETVSALIDYLNAHTQENHVWLAAPFIYIKSLIEQSKNSALLIGSQNISSFSEGAYTGEISARMLNSIGCSFSIIGHSERRQYFHEDDEIILQKINCALQHEVQPVFCCGETLAERKPGKQFEIIERQINSTLLQLGIADAEKIIIAYEPVWAIGTGVSAKPEQAQEMHAFIRSLLAVKWGSDLSSQTRILYGGSVKPTNASDLFAQPDIDGALVGGASLSANEFIQIIESA